MWVETTQEDFLDGIYERNIYASHLDGGTIQFAPRFDLNNDGYLDLYSLTSGSIRIYWGSANGYSASNKISFSTDGTGNCEGADLNNDGYPEFIASYGNNDPRLVIYWGSASGYNSSNNFSIPTVTNEVTYVADLNKDGYLDMIVGTSLNFSTSSIYWGSSSGYSSNNRTDLPTVYGAHNFEVADLNKDGWYDIIVVNNNATYNYIFWGSQNGYSSVNKTSLSLPSVSIPHGSSVADLNSDGYLDLIFTSVYSSYSYIYWGSSNGYQNLQVLNTGASYGGSSVVDMNNDGYLDVVFFRGRPSNRPVIYWGSANGYSDSNRTEVGYSLSASGGFVADLNGDNYYDIFLNNYYGASPIFWGPDYTTSFSFSANGDHHAMFREIGNTYNRAYYEDYISSVFNAGNLADWNTIDWDATTPSGASIRFWVRSGDTATPDPSWSSWYSVTNGGSIPGNLSARYLQYKARFAFTSPAYLPSLDEVRISYKLGCIAASIKIGPEVINLKSHGKFTAFITLPVGYDPSQVDVSTVECEGAMAIGGSATPICFIAKFNVQDLVGVAPGPAVPFMVSGQLYDGTPFSGYDTVKVISPGNVTLMCQPNPCKKHTTIAFSYPNTENTTIKIYNINGELIRSLDDINYRNGRGSVIWDRKDNSGHIVPAGVYLYRIQGTTISVTEKVVVLE